MKALITITEFGETYGVSRSTVYRLAERKQITFLKVGRAVRIRRENAESWAANLPCSAVNDS